MARAPHELRILGIESSCDETAAAVVTPRGEILSDIIASQIAQHAPYGGVVPELAARAHLKAILPVVQAALEPVGGLSGIDGVAVTQGPGLVGALLVGTQFGRSLAWARQLPLVGVNHLEGHLRAVQLERETPVEYPYIALLASGGHTGIYEVRAQGTEDEEGGDAIEPIGQTRDDAAGEAFDKVAKLLGLGYPGGPVVDRLAQQGDPRAVELPLPMPSLKTLDFSFSGLKTAIARRIQKHGPPSSESELADLCASFQRAVAHVLVRKSIEACRRADVRRLVLAGGVAANSGLRSRAAEMCEKAGVRLYVPKLRACTDNAAMIAYVGALRFERGERDEALRIYSRDPARRRGKFRTDGTLVRRPSL